MVSQAKDPSKNLAPLTVVDDSNSADVPNLKGDWHNIFVLVLLYTMQGIAGLGLSVGIPALLQINKNVTYKDQVSINDDLILTIIKCSNFRNK